MTTIQKFKLLIASNQFITVPLGGQLLGVKERAGRLMIWAVVDPDQKETEKHHIQIIGDGEPFPDSDDARFIDTATLDDIDFHVFVMKPAQLPCPGPEMKLAVPLVCPYCSEPIVMGDDLARHLVGGEGGPRVWHQECILRSVVGGFNHLKKQCTCCGGVLDPDPPDISRRQAARLAVDEWQRQQRVAAYQQQHPEGA